MPLSEVERAFDAALRAFWRPTEAELAALKAPPELHALNAKGGPTAEDDGAERPRGVSDTAPTATTPARKA